MHEQWRYVLVILQVCTVNYGRIGRQRLATVDTRHSPLV